MPAAQTPTTVTPCCSQSSSCTGTCWMRLENPNTRVLGTFENDTVTGVFALLVLEDEKYLELLAGLSRSAAAYDELLAHLKSAYPGLSGGLCL